MDALRIFKGQALYAEQTFKTSFGLTFIEGVSFVVTNMEADTGKTTPIQVRLLHGVILDRDKKPPVLSDQTYGTISLQELAEHCEELVNRGKPKVGLPDWLQ